MADETADPQPLTSDELLWLAQDLAIDQIIVMPLLASEREANERGGAATGNGAASGHAMTSAGHAALRLLSHAELATVDAHVKRYIEPNRPEGAQTLATAVQHARQAKLPDQCLLVHAVGDLSQTSIDRTRDMAEKLQVPIVQIVDGNRGRDTHITTPDGKHYPLRADVGEAAVFAALPSEIVEAMCLSPDPLSTYQRDMLAKRLHTDHDEFVERMNAFDGSNLAAISQRRLTNRAQPADTMRRVREQARTDFADVSRLQHGSKLADRAWHTAERCQQRLVEIEEGIEGPYVPMQPVERPAASRMER